MVYISQISVCLIAIALRVSVFKKLIVSLKIVICSLLNEILRAQYDRFFMKINEKWSHEIGSSILLAIYL